MAYITGAGTVPGAAADLLAAGLNMNLGGWRLSPGASEIERCLIRWLASAFGLPAEGGRPDRLGRRHGQLHRAEGGPRPPAGVRGPAPRRRRRRARWPSTRARRCTSRPTAPWTCSGSGPTRSARIPVDGDYRMRMDALADAMRTDRAAGVRPLIVVATARHGRDRFHRSAARDRRPLPGRGPVDARRRRVRRPGRPVGRPAAAARRHRARGLDRLRPAQVDVHAPLGRLRPGARRAAAPGRVPGRGELRPRGRGARRARGGLRAARRAVQPGLPGAEDLGVAAGARPARVLGADRARRGAREVPGGPRRGARLASSS